MKRLYRLANMSHNEWWVVATSEEEAVEHSVKIGRIRRPESARRIRDCTDQISLQGASNSPLDFEAPCSVAIQILPTKKWITP